jgi:hypothetical protein
MYQIIHNLALAAALIVLVVSLWQDWGLFPTVKRMLISYLGFFFLSSIMVLAVKLVGVLEKDHDSDDNTAGHNAGTTQETS